MISAPKAVIPLAAADPVAVLAAFADDPFALLLESGGRYSYLCVRPRTILTATAWDDSKPFARLAQALGPRRPGLPGLPPFQGGAAGLLGYDLAHHLERLPRHQPDALGLPDMAIGLFDAVLAWDHSEGKAFALGEAGLAADLAKIAEDAPPLPPLDWTSTAKFSADWTVEQYHRQARRVIDYIFAGDIFQANLSQRFSAPRPKNLTSLMLYRRLRQLTPAPFGAYLALGSSAVLSASPERFLKLTPDGQVESRPIKGTRGRGLTAEQDHQLGLALCSAAKDRAENLMIVDLMRNDLSRVCRPGSVKVPALCTLERHPTVHHLVSVVTGQLAAGLGPIDLLSAAFPGGSITGAPKLRAMEIIAELEPLRRGAYTGSLGWIGFDGAMDSNIAIRTMVMTDQRIVAQAGGGITADSDPAAEYEETLIKAKAMLASLEGMP